MYNVIDFSKAKELKRMHGKNLLEDYDYKLSNKILWFSGVERHFNILKVEKITNLLLYGMYLLSFEELENSNLFPCGLPQKKVLYHVTSPTNAKQIARSNIDWRKTFRSRFGMGACFSPCPEYAHRYASSNGAFVIFEVLTKNIQNNVGVQYGKLRVPSEKYDTTLSYNKKVYVKYDDYQFYPRFIVYYTNKNLLAKCTHFY